MKLIIPPPSSAATTNVMKANRAKGTSPENRMKEHLRSIGLRSYRLSYNKVPGRPDICYPGKKIAIFVHGCFWHRCPKCNLALPKSNVIYWKEKFKRNEERDERKRRELEEIGWKVFEFWECDIKRKPLKLANQVKKYVGTQNLR